jgi:peptidoglycan hydrolase CwlO-like protein
MRRPRHLRLILVGLLPAVAALVLWSALPVGSGAQSAGDLQQRIDSKRSAEQRLSADAATFAQIADRLARQVALIERRRAQVQAELNANEGKLEAIKADLRRERARLARLRARLDFSRKVLSRRLREMYVSGKPDLVTVVLSSRGFVDLLERAEFLRRIKEQDQRMIVAVRSARDASRRAAGRLAALRHARGSRQRLERELARLQSQQNAGMSHYGPGGPWAIPWAIVQCESGGVNHPPNWAGASGYYQIIPSTWSGFGGQGPAAYLASKGEQDRVATLIWDNGRGARNWDCAYIVGIL